MIVEPEKQPIIQASSEIRRFVQAGPGTGKTFCLIERIKYLVEEEGLRPGTEILVLSFSVAAVSEVRKRLAESASEHSEGSDLPLVEIRTFDSFATRFLINLGKGDSLMGKGYEERIEMAIEALKNDGAVDDHLGDIRHMMVDEVQDLVGARAQMTLELLDKVGKGKAGFTLFGDLAQGIYDFQLEGEKEAMTSVEFLEGVRERFPTMGKDARLGKNFRAAGQEKLEYLAERGRELILDDIGEGAEFLFREFDALKSLGELAVPKDLPVPISVLCRDNGQVLRLASTLRDRKDPIYISPKKDSRYLPPWIGLILIGWKGRLIRKAEFEKCFRESGREDFPDVEQCWRDLLRFGRSRSDRKKVDLSRLRVALGENASFSRDSVQPKDSVTLSTIHRSKGREYDRVAVVMSDGVRPEEAIDSDSPVVDEDVEGETKVLFVALTRARETLFRMKEGARDGLRLAPPKKERWIEMPVRTGPYGTYNQFRSIEVGLAEDIEPHSFVSMNIHGDLEGVRRNQGFLEERVRGEEVALEYSRMSEGVPVFSVLVICGDQRTAVGETSEKFGRDFRTHAISGDGRLRKFPHQITGLWISEVVTEVGEAGREDVPREFSSFPVWLGIRLQGLGRCEDWIELS